MSETCDRARICCAISTVLRRIVGDVRNWAPTKGKKKRNERTVVVVEEEEEKRGWTGKVTRLVRIH
jgi:hypothetical protein